MLNYLAMLSIKLVRTGKKNLPSFRIVVGSGKKIVETLGHYYPLSKSPLFKVVKERIEHWRNSGARLTPAVAALLKGKYEFRRYVPKSGVKSEEVSPAASQPVSSDATSETIPVESKEAVDSPTETPLPEKSGASQPVEEEKDPENA